MFQFLGRWREAGFDSIQFPNHWEDGIHKFEIWDLRAMEWDKTLRCTHLMITRIRVHRHAEYRIIPARAGGMTSRTRAYRTRTLAPTRRRPTSSPRVGAACTSASVTTSGRRSTAKAGSTSAARPTRCPRVMRASPRRSGELSPEREKTRCRRATSRSVHQKGRTAWTSGLGLWSMGLTTTPSLGRTGTLSSLALRRGRP